MVISCLFSLLLVVQSPSRVQLFVYRVRGIYSSWRELLGTLPMPQIVEASLIPFQNVIIHDGIVMPYGVCLGKNMADQAKYMYMNAKEQKRIIECI